MKRLILSLLVALPLTTHAALMRGADGRWYGNLCVTQMGVQPVGWQPVGTICFAPGFNTHGFIANF